MQSDMAKRPCAYEGCEEEALTSSEERHCIFHERDENKDMEEFQRLLRAKLRRKDYNFKGYSFVGKTAFRDYVFTKDADFHKALFSGDVDFEKTQFVGRAVFNEATFSGRALFLGAKFSGDERVDFREAVFSEKALFSGAEFSGEALFWQTVFHSDALFWHASFLGKALFLDARFEGEGKIDFRGATFSGEALFTGAAFSNDVYFSEGRFMEKAIFKGVKFSGEGKADFQKTTFSKDALFQGAKFSGGAHFKRALFSADADFEEARFVGEINFGAIDLGTLHLAESNVDTLDLTNAQWSKDFKNTYERGAESIEDYKRAEEIYRKVKISYHRTGDYNLGAEFYYREMESRRKQLPFEKINFLTKFLKGVGYNFLRLYCGYGEKPLRVIGCSLIIIVLCALLFMVFGIHDSQGSVLIKLNMYDLFHNFGIETVAEKLKHFWSCFYYSVITFTTVGYGDIRPTTGLARLLAMVEGFFGAFSIALFVLTFGRKMMR